MRLIGEKLKKLLMLLLIIVLNVATLCVIFFGIQQFKIGSQLSSINQIANLSHILIRQQANLFSVLLDNNAKTASITEHLNNLVRENFVLDATVYDQTGKEIAQSSNVTNSSLKLELGEQKAKRYNGVNMLTQQIVEPIYSNGKIIGFLRATFDSQYSKQAQSNVDQIFHRLYGEFIIVFLLGILCASSIDYFLYRYFQAHNKSIGLKSTVAANLSQKSSSQRFHQRRRKFL